MTAPNKGVGNFKKYIYIKCKFSESFFEKIEKKNVLSRKLQKIEQSNLKARFANTKNTLTAPLYKEGGFIFDSNLKRNLTSLKVF